MHGQQNVNQKKDIMFLPCNRKLVVFYPGKDTDYHDFPWFYEVLL